MNKLTKRIVLHVAIPSPLRKSFDYLAPDNYKLNALKPGIRLLVPFGHRKKCIGFLLSTSHKSELPDHKLKKIFAIIDQSPLLNAKPLELLRWASRYYQYPVGEVIFNALPGVLRQGKACRYPSARIYKMTSLNIDPQILNKAPKQKLLLQKFLTSKTEQNFNDIKNWQEYSPQALKALVEKELLKSNDIIITPNNLLDVKQVNLPESTATQNSAIETILQSADTFSCFLLNGVTGSGKTQVYMKVIEQIVQSGKQALILLPEIGLTPQFIQRFQIAFNTEIGLYHSGLSEQERLMTWMRAGDQTLSIILGTRSSIWLAMKKPGVIIIDEEHDLSYKQQDGFRYSARDIAVIRAQKENIPIILGTATPSMETLHNVQDGRYLELKLPMRIGDAVLPEIQTVDLKASLMQGALSQTLIKAMQSVLKKQQQVLLFINRRGFAPVVLCHHCGHVIHCNRCDKAMTYHKQRQIIWCHHCDRQLSIKTTCPECHESEWVEVGHGTERIEEDIQSIFPEYRIVRIDRDTTRHKGKLDEFLQQIQSGEAQIMIGTQMLAKGHHFPDLTLVGILDMDSGLYSTDFRASERMAQLLIQVSGRAGRHQAKGLVLLQTHHPDHPLLKTLIKKGYESFSQLLLQERRETGLPPYSYHVLLRAEATKPGSVELFLNDAKRSLTNLQTGLGIYGPIMAPLQRKAGRFRMQLLLETNHRRQFSKYLNNWTQTLAGLKSARSVRWNLDIDPQDMM